ncbi:MULTISPECIES: hypothetical protein [unclassified Microcoleus]|uniref:hypothetical protein n=1 Tax=unclassified Microcoleus TaxID=2642155 RepID=UPI002FD3C8D0
MDISTTNWFESLGTTIQPVFNTAAMTNLSPSEVIFGAAVAYREAQEAYNAGTSVTPGEYINFASPLLEDTAPALDAAGDISKNQVITLRAKIVYVPDTGLQPQNSTTII